jgi:hypothetical protein
MDVNFLAVRIVFTQSQPSLIKKRRFQGKPGMNLFISNTEICELG